VMQMIRLTALGTAIYLAIFLTVMLNPVVEKLGGHWLMLVLVLVLAAVPAFVNFYALSVLVSDFVVVSSVESMRDPEIIGYVKRGMVTKKAMTALKLLVTMKNSLPKVGESGEECERKSAAEVWPDPHVRAEKRRENREMFDLFDADGSNGIDAGELGHLLEMMGIGGDQEGRQRIFDQIDAPDENGNRDGDICFEEFFDWIASNTAEEEEEVDEEHLKEMGKQLFEMIDTPDENGVCDGEITPEEFHNCMLKLSESSGNKLEISLEDVEALFREVDEDHNGSLDEEEFNEMLEKYMFE